MSGEESSHYGEAVGWEGKVGGGQPPCKETADPVLQAEPVGQLQTNLSEDMQMQQPSLSLKLAGSA